MAAKERRFLGDLDAAADTQFKDHFVESVDLSRLLNKESHIIYGTKGVGKTALRRALTELNSNHFYTTKTIDLDQLSFNQVHEALDRLSQTSRTEFARVASNTWRNLLAGYCLEAVVDKMPGQLRGQIASLLTKEGSVDSAINSRAVGHIERLFQLLAEISLDDDATKPLSLTSQQIDILDRFPSNPKVADLLQRCSAEVSRTGKSVLICLDGFDSIVVHSAEARTAIFAGLIDSIHKSSKDSLLRGAFCFKAFLPQELASQAGAMVWDSDKFLPNTHQLRWSLEDFQVFLARRLATHAKTKSSRFVDMWQEFMPEKVRNDIHGIEEPTFDYILRHTLYRPRQLLTHVQNLLDRWDELSDEFRVDPTFVPQTVANANREMASAVISQLEVKYGGLHKFMRSWSGACNTITASQFQERIRRLFGLTNNNDVLDLFDDLFECGVFGFAKRSSIASGSQRTRFRFSFVADQSKRNVHASIDGEDILALSPMFHEFCGCTPSQYGAITPVAM
jgi:hypothetical protein